MEKATLDALQDDLLLENSRRCDLLWAPSRRPGVLIVPRGNINLSHLQP
jgi:hypothetical protein